MCLVNVIAAICKALVITFKVGVELNKPFYGKHLWDDLFDHKTLKVGTQHTSDISIVCSTGLLFKNPSHIKLVRSYPIPNLWILSQRDPLIDSSSEISTHPATKQPSSILRQAFSISLTFQLRCNRFSNHPDATVQYPTVKQFDVFHAAAMLI